MNRILPLTAAALALSLLGASTAAAMTCQNRLVRPGDPASRLSSLCGEPTQIVRRTVVRTRAVHRQLPNGAIISDTVTFDVPIEEWTYDIGPRRLIRVVVIENGVVSAIQTGGYGTSPG